MNERIRKLAIETDAWCDQRYLGDQFYDIEWEQKFAELIVQECANVIINVTGLETDTEWNRAYQSGLRMAIDTVNKHFGDIE